MERSRKQMKRPKTQTKRSRTQMDSNTTVFYHFLPSKLEEEEQNLNRNKSSVIKKEVVWINNQRPNVLLPLFDPWVIKKVLTDSDVGFYCRLSLSKEIVQNFIYPNWDPAMVNDVEFLGDLKEVNVRDLEKGSEHVLVFSKLKSNGSYILNGGWNTEFVMRRELKVNDLIGLYWNSRFSFFDFAVLARANPADDHL